MYGTILKPILFRFSPDKVHDAFVNVGEWAGRFGVCRAFFALIYGYEGKDISKVVDGVYYKTPIILSAGFDYNARLTRILPSLSFGGVEVGSVTARPCLGNPAPQLTRLPKSRSILVNKGLKNDGVDKIIERLKNTPREKDFVIGVSIARTNDQASSEVDEGIEDYAYSFRRLNEEGVGDYYTINISCPNAFGGEAFTTPELLHKLLSRLKEIPCSKPVYIKLPINLEIDKIEELLEVIDKLGYSGVVVGNLNKDYSSLAYRDEAPASFRGGLSGKPCFVPSNQLIKSIRAKYGKRLTIIGCGGVLSPENATTKFAAGSDLVELITGMIFKGPGLIKDICTTSSL